MITSKFSSPLVRQKFYFFMITVLVLGLLLTSCGGGGGGSTTPISPPPPPAADFSLTVGTDVLTLQQGGAITSETIQVTTSNGFSGTVQLTLSGLPAGVTTAPAAPFSLPSSGTVQFQLQASSSSAVGNATVTATGTCGAITHSVTFTVNVTQAAPWTIQLSPPTLSLSPGVSATVQVSLTSTASPAPQLMVSLPNADQLQGVNVAWPQGFLTPTNPVNFVINTTAIAQSQNNYPIQVAVSDNAGNSTHTALPLTITVPYSANTTPTRSTFARTDASPSGMVYDQARKLLFVSVEILNEVVVLSTQDGHRVATIPVNYPTGIDESADGSAVYVISPYFSPITIIDPNLLQVVGKAEIPWNVAPYGVGLFQLATLSNGKVLLCGRDANEMPAHLLWDPAGQSFAPLNQPVFDSFANASGSLITRSADHRKVLEYGSSGGGGGVLYDVATNSTVGPNSAVGPYSAISPDGSQVVSAASQSYPTVFFDSGLNQVGSLSLNSSSVSGVIYSLDGKHIYIIGDPNLNATAVTVLDASSGSITGLVPSFAYGVNGSFSGWIKTFAVDETNMIFGATGQGVGFTDASSPTSLTLPLPGLISFEQTLASATTPTTAQISGSYFSQDYSYKLYLGAPPASAAALQATNLSIQNSNFVNLTIPASGYSGPVNATFTRSDGYFQVRPDAISFGPSVLRIDANAGSASGGDQIKIWGYGFDREMPKVTVGGSAATVSYFGGNVMGSPLPIESITLTTPAGAAGDADVVVSNSMGSITIPGGFQYLQPVQTYARSGSLQALVYDQPRQRLYLSNMDHNQVEVFDLGSNTFLTPIPVGNAPTWVALTPDGTALAVVNRTDGTVTAIDPAQLKVKATYPVLTASDLAYECQGVVTGLTAAIPHRMVVSVTCANVYVWPSEGTLRILDLDTGNLSCTGIAGCTTNGIDFNWCCGSMASSPDGTKVFLANGQNIILDLSANTFTYGERGGYEDAAANADGTIFAGGFWSADAKMRALSLMAWSEPYADAGPNSNSNVFGEKLSLSGSLLFVPQSSGIDVFDVHTGRLAQHIVLPNPVAKVRNAVAFDETGMKMFVISSSGLMIAQINQLPLSMISANPSAGPVGTSVVIRGSGFVPGTVVLFGSSQSSATFIDANTLHAVVPSMQSGPVRITVKNPDGKFYTFDNAFAVQ